MAFSSSIWVLAVALFWPAIPGEILARSTKKPAARKTPHSLSLQSSSSHMIIIAIIINVVFNTASSWKNWLVWLVIIKASEASRRYRGRGLGRDGPNGDVHRTTPPRGMIQSGWNFRGIIRTYGRMHIYKISPIGQETRKLPFLGTPVDALAAANVADGTLALPCRVARLIYLIYDS